MYDLQQGFLQKNLSLIMGPVDLSLTQVFVKKNSLVIRGSYIEHVSSAK